jgi:hypothetical protein
MSLAVQVCFLPDASCMQVEELVPTKTLPPNPSSLLSPPTTSSLSLLLAAAAAAADSDTLAFLIPPFSPHHHFILVDGAAATAVLDEPVPQGLRIASVLLLGTETAVELLVSLTSATTGVVVRLAVNRPTPRTARGKIRKAA